MSAMQAVADRVEIEALRAELTDAVMMRDFDRDASLFTPRGVMRWTHVDKEVVSREQIRAGGAWGSKGVGSPSCGPFTQASFGSTVTPRPAAPASRNAGGCATALPTCTAPCTTTTTSAPRTADGSTNASTRSGTWPPLRRRARR